jgi:hypothetical protein
MDLAFACLFLPVSHLTAKTAQLPLYPYLFTVHDRSIEKAWPFQRCLLVCKTYFKL